MKFNVHSLAFKQTLLILLGITVIFGTLLLTLQRLVNTRMSELIMARGQEISEKHVSLIDNIFDGSASIVKGIVDKIEQGEISQADMGDFLPAAYRNAHDKVAITSALVVAYEPENGKEFIRITGDGLNGKVLNGSGYQSMSWYVEAKAKGKGIWCEPFISNYVDKPVAVYAMPFYETLPDGSKKFKGVVCLDILLSFLRDAVASIQIENSGYAFILSAENKIVAHPRDDWIFKETLYSLAKGRDANLSDFEKAVRELHSGILLGKTFKGESACIYFSHMKVDGWVFGIVWPADEFFEKRRKMTSILGMLSLLGYALMFGLVLVISSRVSRPLKELASVAKRLGQGDFEVEIPQVKGKDEIAEFAEAFGHMRDSLKENIEKQKGVERVQNELEMARKIQLGLLAKNDDDDGVKDNRHKLYPFILPAKEVGGDFYDFVKVDENRLAFLIADVSGKGIPAALLMMSSRSMLKSVVLAGSSVEDTFNVVNDRLAFRNYLNMFVTVWMGILDLRTGEVEFACAGHNPPVICHDDGTVEFAKSRPGLVLAAMEGTRYKRQTLKLEPGDTIFLYTDGVTEATNANEELFGDDRLLQTLREACGMEPAEICPFVKSKIDAFVGDAPQFDDITMLALKFVGKT
ncbi:SpoIIE family protein phosphatase [Fibrobacter sp. UBA4297]|uniref:SpoIIE family protein phosphatase n=1 Tax=Fibrobacter sp. UBA4297 TaxID=1946536 RepID=UPI0025C08751|nr:SpoIIE family protein phosphatase [Fibrobacter sp. UBA4297]